MLLSYMVLIIQSTSLANLVLEDTIERIYHGQTYADDPVGLFLIRGENVVLLGEVVRCSLKSEYRLTNH